MNPKRVEAIRLLQSLLETDQKNIGLFSPGGIEPSEFKSRNDKVNQAFLEFLTTNGFPFKDTFGDEAYEAGIVLALHSKEDVLERALNLIEGADETRVDRAHKAYFIDKLKVYRSQKQIYGTQFKRLSDGTIDFLPIEDEAAVDKRRSALGLCSLAEYKRAAERREKPPRPL